MKHKRIVGVALASSIALTAAFTGCSLTTTDVGLDMNKVVATVNISNAEGTDPFDTELITNFKSAVGTTEIYKSELVAYFINVGSSYVNSGYSYADVFNMLVDGLVQNAVITQYAVMYLLNDKAGTGAASTVLEKYNAKETYIDKLEYLLTDDSAGAEDPDKDVKIARYNFYSSVNSAIDSYETALLEEEDENAGTETRDVPTGVDTEVEDYYPAAADKSLDYGIYTGYKGNLIADSGVYKDDMLTGSNQITRTKAYNNFISALINNNLVDPQKDALRNIYGGIDGAHKAEAGIEYMQKEYISQLENRVVYKYYDLYEQEQESKLTDDNNYDYLNAVYESQLNSQTQSNQNSGFTSTMDSLSDSSFILYAPDTEDGGTYGFVYNILLPFSAKQSAALTTLQTTYKDEDEESGYTADYYIKRNDLMKQIVTTDQRSAWFNGTTDYAFNALEAGIDYYKGTDENRSYLFFENNLTNNGQYEELGKYIGKYSYNGKVYELSDGKYQLIPNKLDIDGMLAEFKAYVDYVLGGEKVTFYNSYDPATVNEAYYTSLTKENLYKDSTADKKEIDYGKFIYASGAVDLGGSTASNLLYEGSEQYKALAAVNELQYAYTTDTGILSKYLGYSVNIGNNTGYIKEFEYAAQQAIAKGAGSFTVCAGDYGWHLIYVTYTYGSTGGAVYTPDWAANVNEEGTFENLFYEWVKSKNISEISTKRRTQIMTQFNKDNTVNKIQKAYQDLLDLG